ncbi:MAG: MFS transporter [Acidobacteriota bacterium]
MNLFTRRFFLLCSFTFVTFLSAFLLFPTMPLRILALGGTKTQAGLFLGFLTYSSAFSAPFCGALGDRLGRRLMLFAGTAVILMLSAVYAFSTSLWVILPAALVHGFFWSGLLSSCSALVTEIIPPERRAEGFGYSGMMSILGVAVAPALGIYLFHYGWIWVCIAIGALTLAGGAILLRIREDRAGPRTLAGLFSQGIVERRVFVLALAMFLCSFGHGGVTSFVALYAQESGTRPTGIFFIVFALTIVVTRPFIGRLADRLGRTRVLVPCLASSSLGLGLLAISGRLPVMIAAAMVLGIGFGSVYPVLAAHVMERVDSSRRGATFGSMLLAFDTGIGTGSILLGICIDHYGYRVAFGLGALVALTSIPYFLVVDRWQSARAARPK